MKIRFIVNPIAGGENRLDEITEAVRKYYSSKEGIFEIRATKDSDDAGRLAKDAVKKNYDIIFVSGGDGTINDVATELVNTDVTLSIIPSGSGNGLARSLKIPFDVEEAVSLPLTGKKKKIDVGSISGQYFFSTAGIGFDAILSKKYNKKAKKTKKRGIGPYVPMAVFEFFKYKAETLLIRNNDKFKRVTPFILTIANTPQYGGGAFIAPKASVTDGKLDMCLITDEGFFKALKTARRLMDGTIEEDMNYEREQITEIEIRRNKKGLIQVDGEAYEGGEVVQVKVLPEALNVWVKG